MNNQQSIVHIVDDDDAVRDSLTKSLSMEGFTVKDYASALEFLNDYNNQPGCLIADIQMPKLSGLELQDTLIQRNESIPLIFITGHGNISMSVDAIKSGAIDFIEKPFSKNDLLKSIRSALEIDQVNRKDNEKRSKIQERYELLTAREKEVMKMLVRDFAKLNNKDIADELGISKRTVEVHRSSIMSKMLAKTRSQLVELSKFCSA